MPFFSTSGHVDYSIDYSRYKPITVLTCFLSDGQMQPMIIKFSADDDTLTNIEIKQVIQRKEYPHEIHFCCQGINYGHLNQYYLIFSIPEHIWLIRRDEIK